MTTVCIYDSAARRWVRFHQLIDVIATSSVEKVASELRRVESAVADKNCFAAGFLSYEAAPAFDKALRVRDADSSFPLLWFGLFERIEEIELPLSASSQKLSWTPTISRDEFDSCIARIRHHIAEGDTYQVNFSFRLRSEFVGNPFEFFLQLAQAQPSHHGAFIETDEFAICSASPELFFSLDGYRLVSRPMKGTTRRGLTLKSDTENAEILRRSEKNWAENVMIVDMIRNDMGRVARVDTVRVPALFDVERYPTVWQMTSTVEARTDASISEIMNAMFPCASITGAPKANTMKIIAGLESTTRGIYTGAIGFIAPDRKAQFNVAIRTVHIDKAKGTAEYGVGGGIVWDSTSEGEYEECLTKARVLTAEWPQFELFETMLFTQRDGFFLLDEHLARLKDSAAYFDLPLDEPLLNRMLKTLQTDLRVFSNDQRVRMVLHSDGKPTFAIATIDAGAVSSPFRVRLAATPVDSQNPFIYHKTTFRKVYDDALASASDCDDVILWNERGDVTESTIANVVVEIDGKLYTPPIECGLLAGTLRERLLREGSIKERV
ncbi:MAG: aminodeoxychorismate synthase component I, partial [Ignavibacteriae bacterium]|nr:aminodeoxychorismate synthase component I [Ignavibacteriota bacterium]